MSLTDPSESPQPRDLITISSAGPSEIPIIQDRFQFVQFIFVFRGNTDVLLVPVRVIGR